MFDKDGPVVDKGGLVGFGWVPLPRCLLTTRQTISDVSCAAEIECYNLLQVRNVTYSRESDTFIFKSKFTAKFIQATTAKLCFESNTTDFQCNLV